MSEMESLEKLLGAPREVLVWLWDPDARARLPHTVEVREVTMRDLREFSSVCAPFFEEFGEGGRLNERVDPETGERIPLEAFALFHVIADHGPAFMRAASMVTGKPVAFFEALAPDQFFEVAAAVIQVNGDFFVRSLAPVLVMVGKGLGSIGLGPSKP